MRRARYTLEPTKLPGVWRTTDGRFFVRGQVRDPRTGRAREVSKLVEATTADQARADLLRELANVRAGGPTSERKRFGDYAVSLLERKLARGEIWSPKGLEKWRYTLECHLIPVFGDYYVDAIDQSVIDEWIDKTSERVTRREISAASANTHRSVLSVVLPKVSIPPFRTPPGAETYTEEEPNALKPEDVPRFLGAMAELYPQHFGIVFLALMTGLRPSSLRPLRRRGAEPDILWDEGVLLIRRSQTRGAAVGRTKTGRRQRLALPTEIVDVLRWHVDRFTERQAASDLLFPSETGGYRSPSGLDKPFAAVRLELGLSYHFTPRGLRRTNKDLGRRSEMSDVLSMAISGHKTTEMHAHYSTVRDDEVRSALGRMLAVLVPGEKPGDGSGGSGDAGGSDR